MNHFGVAKLESRAHLHPALAQGKGRSRATLIHLGRTVQASRRLSVLAGMTSDTEVREHGEAGRPSKPYGACKRKRGCSSHPQARVRFSPRSGC